MLVIDKTDMGGMSFEEQCDPPYRFSSRVLLGCGSTLVDPGDHEKRALTALGCFRQALKRGLPIVSVVHHNYGVDVYVQG